MGIYGRKLKRGYRYFYSGQYLGVRYFSKAIYKTKTEAGRAERNKRNEIDERARNPINDMPLKTLTEERLNFLKMKSKDYHKENARYFKKLEDFSGDVTVREVTKADIHRLLMAEANRLKKSNRGNYKVNSMLRSLKALFGYARKVHDIEHQPCRDIDFYPITISLKHIPSDTDIQAVKAKCTLAQNELIDFVDQTGCRIMEAVRFTYEDVDGDLITLWTRKSKNSNLTPRRIPKPDCLERTGKGRVFKDWDAYPRFLEEKINDLDQAKWNWHNLRHRRASLWAKSGMPIFELMVRLGHSNLQTTQRYLQLLGFSRF